MKKVIKYYYIKSDHPLAIPEFDHEEVVDVKSEKHLREYIESQKDQYGNKFSKSLIRDVGMHDFDYTSRAGAVKVRDYKPPKIKKLW